MGDHGCSLALGRARVLINNMVNADSQDYQEALSNAKPEVRATMVKNETDMRTSLQESLEEDLAFWNELPASFMGLIGEELHGYDRETIRGHLGKLFQEVQAARDKGLFPKLHRTARQFFQHGTDHQVLLQV